MRYKTIVEQLETEPTDSDELTALVQYQLDCMQLLDDLMDEYQMQAMERQRFLLTAGLEFDKSHMILAATVFMWPAKVKVHQKNSAGLVDKRKKELITLTAGEQAVFDEKLEQMRSKLGKLTEFGSLIPDDVKKAFKLAEQITMLYDEAEAISDTIAGEEAALELEETQNAELLTDFQASFEPLRKLWASAQDYTESSRDWLQLPLAQVL